MPPFLLMTFCVFGVTPLLALSFLPMPYDLWLDGHGAVWQKALTTFAFWIGPIAICLALLKRSIAFLPLFVLECAALAVHAIASSTQAAELTMVRLCLIAFVASIGLTFASRDAIYPLLQRRPRWWRKATRLRVNAKLTLELNGQRVPVMLENCSLSGMAVSGESLTALAAIGANGRGAHGTIHFKASKLDIEIPVELIWFRSEGAIVSAGMRALTAPPMRELLNAVKPRLPLNPAEALLAHLWVKSGFQRTLLALWALAIVGSVGTPACGGGGGGGKGSEDVTGTTTTEGVVSSGSQPNTGSGTGGSGVPTIVQPVVSPAPPTSPHAGNDGGGDPETVEVFYQQGFLSLHAAAEAPNESGSQAWQASLTPEAVKVDGEALRTNVISIVVERE